jgi:hypothetical protein
MRLDLEELYARASQGVPTGDLTVSFLAQNIISMPANITAKPIVTAAHKSYLVATGVTREDVVAHAVAVIKALDAEAGRGAHTHRTE